MWTFGQNEKLFLNVLAAGRVAQIARSYGCTPLAAWLLDCVFTGLLHPPGFKCYPTANAPRHPTQEPENAFPTWVSQLVQSLQDEVGQRDAPLSTERKVDVMEAVCVVSLGGAAKSHLLEFYHKLVEGLGAPEALRVKHRSPIQRRVSNFSALAIMAKSHGKVVYCPDEWGMAILPTRGAQPKGTSTSQMMSLQDR